MSLTFSKLFAPVQLAATETTVFTMPVAPTTSVLKNGRIRLTNTSAGAVAVTMHAVPNGGTASATNAFMSAQSIPANSYLDVDVPSLAAGDVVTGFAGTAAVISVHELGGVLYS